MERRGADEQPDQEAYEEEVLQELDLTDERVDEATASARPKSISGRRESTRSIIAYTLLGVLILTSAGWVLAGIFSPGSPAESASDKIFAGVLGLTGTVVGFYFGSASQERRS